MVANGHPEMIGAQNRDERMDFWADYDPVRPLRILGVKAVTDDE